jgi:outer membrane receptor protein involved in Fe transport
MTKSHLFMGAAAFAVAIAVSQPAFAQEAAAEAECVDADANGVCDSDEAESRQIVVTGSRIARPTLDSPTPITSVSAEELLNDGSISLGDALNDLPSLRSTFSTSNSQRFIGTSGLNILDLRGLGTTRTLTLVNGRRHITASPGDFQVDINTIPFELLERIDVVTGGSSAVYGSDAIAGVVNVVLKRDYDGFEINGQGGISSRSDNGRYSASLAFGRNFADGRGNLAVVAEYSRISPLYNTQRPDISGFDIGFTAFSNTSLTNNEGVTNSNGIPDLAIRSGLKLHFISDGGTFSGICVSDPATQPLACDNNFNDIVYRFGPDGRLSRDNGVIEDLRNTGDSNVVGGGGSTFGGVGTLIPLINRYNFNVLGHFDVSDAFRPYGEFKFARIDAKGSGTPSFLNSFCGGSLAAATGLNTSCFQSNANSANYFIRYDNPFLNPADATFIRSVQDELLGVFGVPPISSGFTIARNNEDFGPREDVVQRDTYRAVLGVEGDISSVTKYDLSMTYGKFKSSLTATNNLIVPNMRNAVDAVRLPSGQIVCRINADTVTTNDDPACVPINLFGNGAPSAAAVDYVNGIAQVFERASQLDVTGYVRTDSSGLFSLPGGPIRMVAGFEYRRETASSEADALSASGVTFFNAFQPFTPPAYKVLEGFGEIELPILKDLPFAEELTLSAAGRISDYNSGAGLTGKTESYNLNAVYAPISDIRLRANYSRAVRAPNPSDLFSPTSQNFVFLTDPCDRRNINAGTATRAANCAAAGVPTAYQQAQGNRSVAQGGNPFLKAETSTSLTLGAVFEPRFAPGFNFTVDYYDIKVKNVIANVSGNAILSNCYDAPSLDNSFCPLINPRNADGSFNSVAAINIAPVNFAKLTARGIDFDAQYRKTFENGDRVTFRAIASHVIARDNFLDVTFPDLPNRIDGELGDPKWAFNVNAGYRTGAITLSYSVRWLDKMSIGAIENYVPHLGICPASGTVRGQACTPGALETVPAQNPDFTAEKNYPSIFYHDIRLDWRVNTKFQFYIGVDNLTDKLPPFGLTGAGAGSGIYNNTGRYFFAGFSADL